MHFGCLFLSDVVLPFDVHACIGAIDVLLDRVPPLHIVEYLLWFESRCRQFCPKTVFPGQMNPYPSLFCAQNGRYINTAGANILATQVPIPNAESMD